jgi:transcriptional regulator with XRE-family HTH domain
MFETTMKKENRFQEKKMTIVNIIRDGLKKRDFSQADFARIMDRHRPEITKWLSGSHNFQVETLFEIETKLGVNIFHNQPTYTVMRAQPRNISLRVCKPAPAVFASRHSRREPILQEEMQPATL